MNYKDIQKTGFYYETYSKIEELKKDFPVNHGFLHVNHVVSNAKKLAKTFNLNNKQKYLLYIACVLHDIGYLKGRENHAKSGGEIAREYLEANHFKPKDIDIICNAITRHGGKDISDYQNPISLCLVLADKLDFISTRYNPNIKDYPVDNIFLAIKSLEFILNKSEIVLKFNVRKGFNKESFIAGHFGRKLISVFNTLSEVLSKPYHFEYVYL